MDVRIKMPMYSTCMKECNVSCEGKPGLDDNIKHQINIVFISIELSLLFGAI